MPAPRRASSIRFQVAQNRFKDYEGAKEISPVIVLPVSLVVSLVLLALLARALIGRDSHWTLLLLIAACAVQGAILAVHQYYGLQFLRYLQPVTAMAIPPIAWRAFEHASRSGVWSHRIWAHAAGPLLAVIILFTTPDALNAIIPFSFAAYGIVMLLHLRPGESSLPFSSLENGNLPLLAWRVCALSLIASAVCDVLVAWSFTQGKGALGLLIISVTAPISLLSLGLLSFSSALQSRRSGEDDAPQPLSQEDQVRDQSIISSLDEVMAQQRLYLDPDLTLSRLARRLVVPAKDLSAAINRVKGENVSRYINRLRILHACEHLRKGESVTSAMLNSGFNTKSNFNREFLRVSNMSPSRWLSQ